MVYFFPNSPRIAPIAMSQPMYHAPSRLAIIARKINQSAGISLLQNGAAAAPNIPKISIVIPQNNELSAYTG